MLIIINDKIVGAAGVGYAGPGQLVPKPQDFSWDKANQLKYVDGDWIESPPFSVTVRQGFIYLYRIGLLEVIERMFEQLPEPQKTEAKIEWEKTSVIERDNPLLQQVAQMQGWAEEDLNQMFIEASKI